MGAEVARNAFRGACGRDLPPPLPVAGMATARSLDRSSPLSLFRVLGRTGGCQPVLCSPVFDVLSHVVPVHPWIEGFADFRRPASGSYPYRPWFSSAL